EYEQASYSASELLLDKDFSEMSEIELENARQILAELLSIIANFRSRRFTRSHQRVDLDLRSTIKDSMHYNLDLIRLAWKKQKIKKNRLILLCDVSGSMESYSRFLIQFIAGLKHQLSNVAVAVFSTRLTDVTDQLHSKDLLVNLQQIAASVHDWSGGTQIGKCFQEFNQVYAKKISTSRTIVMVLSDGWDRGDARLMHDEIALMRQRIDSLIWLNPLLGRENYQPLCKGIRTALPYIDHFLPAHNLHVFPVFL
ncbi:MAG: VWA domain-containing protein, partial [Clostridia bacterium]|nr:VWA domain-containing protein [Clostridia bacterium]